MAFLWMLILQYHIQNTNIQKGFVRSLEFLKKSWSLPSNFPDLEKSGKMLKSLEFFFSFSKLQQEIYKWFFFFRFGQILFNLVHTFSLHREKSLFLRFLRSVLITYLITWCLGKEIIVLEKKSRKSLEFWIRKSVRTLSTVKMANKWFCWWQGKSFMSVSVLWQVISSTTGNKNCVSNIADSDILGFLFLTLHTLPSGTSTRFLLFYLLFWA